jgi:hypothetical protein
MRNCFKSVLLAQLLVHFHILVRYNSQTTSEVHFGALQGTL